MTPLDHFTRTADALLIRNRSILDTLSKLQTTCGRVERAVVKAATHCGCIRIQATKQDFTPDPEEGIGTLRERLNSHLTGNLCEGCRDILSLEIGEHLFYLAGLCATLGLNLSTILDQESSRMGTLGVFNLR